MYIPQQYKNESSADVQEFVRQNGFGILINQVDGRPWATHIPLEMSVDPAGNTILVGHIAKANPQWKSFTENSEVLCIFNGPHSYVSSSWYSEEEVPTWNYIAVHMYGTLKILNEAAVLASMYRLVNRYEQHSKNPISIHGMSPKTLRQVKGVVGFEIHITDIQAASKLSQGRADDHPKIISELEESGDAGSKAIAEEMKKRR